MIQLLRTGAFWLDQDPSLSVYNDASLIDISFDLGGWHESQERRLTGLRAIRKSGEIVSLEMRGGVISGVELLGIYPGNWDETRRHYSREIPRTREIPLLSMELDGPDSDTTVNLTTIRQSRQFTTHWYALSGSLEIAFDEFSYSSDFVCGEIFYNQKGQVSGIRLKIGKALGR
ncbi:hypothetical protein [Tahibacter harae]|uniref:Uncharacterized protein n=1 Tax=Tahibacter harae TaxID=2963937 RepID=A0ABT1QWZ5_9GAMM|nr:hypothetical protein [Tahibacter harae]MCQ4166781.1 hypothetical protein [Tahibacter harae]